MEAEVAGGEGGLRDGEEGARVEGGERLAAVGGGGDQAGGRGGGQQLVKGGEVNKREINREDEQVRGEAGAEGGDEAAEGAGGAVVAYNVPSGRETGGGGLGGAEREETLRGGEGVEQGELAGKQRAAGGVREGGFVAAHAAGVTASEEGDREVGVGAHGRHGREQNGTKETG